MDVNENSLPIMSDLSTIDIGSLLKELLRQKWLILFFVIAGLSISYYSTSKTEPLFRAVTTLEIQKQGIQIVQGSTLDSSSVADAEYMTTAASLLKSYSLIEKVVETLSLYSEASNDGLTMSVKEKKRRAANQLLRNIKIVPISRSRLIRVEVINNQPDKAAEIANTLTSTFIDDNIQRKFKTTVYARDFLEERLATTKKSLEKSERALAEYATLKGILELNSTDGAVSLEANAIIAFNTELTRATTERIVAEQDYLSLVNQSQGGGFSENDNLTNENVKLQTLQDEYNQLLLVYKPKHPKMIIISRKMEAIKNNIADIQQADAQSRVELSKIKLEAAKSKEQQIRLKVAELKSSLQNSRNDEIEYTILLREVDTARAQYDALLQRFKEVSIPSDGGASQITIVDPAIVPSSPFSPQLYKNLLKGGILGLLLAMIFAFFKWFFDDKIKTPEAIKTQMGQALIGVVPKLRGKHKTLTGALSDPISEISEAYFSARTTIELSVKGGVPKSILITSVQPSEGKSSTALALGQSFAKTGTKVLLIDADIRNPSFVFTKGSSIGFTGLLRQKHRLLDQVVTTSTDLLYLLPCGDIPENPAELLSGTRLNDILREAEAEFDVVIVDSAPVLNFTDGPILSSLCEATVIVVKADTIRKGRLERAIKRVTQGRANLIGFILTQYDSRKDGISYKYDYNYKYQGYGSNQSKKSSLRRKISIIDKIETD